MVTSVGAKSGNLRKNPVMRVERDGAYLAVASKGGAPENPEWYDNFAPTPRSSCRTRRREARLHARELDGDERDDWWEHAVATWSTYASYQEKTDRLIPLFLLERA